MKLKYSRPIVRALRLLGLAGVSLVLPLPLVAAEMPSHLAAVQAYQRALARNSAEVTVGILQLAENGIAGGSGVIVSKDGLVLTAAHVVARDFPVEVIFPDGTKSPARTLGMDYDNDLALIEIEKDGPFPYAEISGSVMPAQGTPVIATGHHGGFVKDRLPPVRAGMIRQVVPEAGIITNCMMAPGDSGGPLFNLDGRVVGIHSDVEYRIGGQSIHSPACLVSRDWDRYLKGEKWGTNRWVSKPVNESDLAGLDLDRFSAWIMEQIGAGGTLPADQALIKGKLLECGMAPQTVAKLSPTEMDGWINRAIEKLGASLTTRTEEVEGFTSVWEDDQGNEILPTAEELHGMDFTAFRKRVINAARSGSGALRVGSHTVREWLVADGMDRNVVSSLPDREVLDWAGRGIGREPGLAVIEEKPAKTAGGIAVEAVPFELSLQKADLEWINGLAERISPSVVRLVSGSHDLALGSVVRQDGRILTKWSQVKNPQAPVEAILTDGRRFPAELVRGFTEHDLAIFKIEVSGLEVVSFPDTGASLAAGSMIFSPGPGKNAGIISGGIVSVAEQHVADGGNGYLGAVMSGVEDGLAIKEIRKGSPAEHSGLNAGDVITAFDGNDARDHSAAVEALQRVAPGEKIRVDFTRNGGAGTCEVILGSRNEKPDAPTPSQNGISAHSSGYPVSFENDQPLQPHQCGGPLIGADGTIEGINIARNNRASSKAIPSKVIANLLKNHDF